MSVLCQVSYNEALQYAGKALSTKINGKKHQIYLKVSCDDTNLPEAIKLARGSRNILMLNYQGLDTCQDYVELGTDIGVYIIRVFEFGADLTEDDLSRIVADTPPGVVPVISLPDSYNDLEALWRMSKRFKSVRFSGGDLFQVDGILIGEVGNDILDRAGVKHTELLRLSMDALDVVSINDLDVLTTVSAFKERVVRQNKADKFMELLFSSEYL